MKEELASLQKEIEQKTNLLNFLTKTLNEYPDLTLQTDRWHKRYYCSKTANPEVTHFYLKRSCGCCRDSSLLAVFYLEKDSQKVYSNPFEVSVGQGDEYSGQVRLDPAWKTKVQNYGFPDHLIEDLETKLQIYLREENDARESD